MSDRPRLSRLKPIDKRTLVGMALKVFLKWFFEQPFWWTSLLSCMLVTLGTQVIGGYLLVSGNLEGFIKIWTIGWIALILGFIPLIKLFGPYLRSF